MLLVTNKKFLRQKLLIVLFKHLKKLIEREIVRKGIYKHNARLRKQ